MTIIKLWNEDGTFRANLSIDVSPLSMPAAIQWRGRTFIHRFTTQYIETIPYCAAYDDDKKTSQRPE